MARNRKHLGMTLIEITVVVAIIATLVGFGAPAVRALLKSFQSESATRAMVQSALDTARTLAMANQRPIGVRFQKAYDWTLPADQQPTGQYMIFVTHMPLPTEIGYAREFHALMGHKPIPLPSQYLVTDLMITPGIQLQVQLPGHFPYDIHGSGRMQFIAPFHGILQFPHPLYK